METDIRTNSLTNPVTVADLHAGLHNILRAWFHGKIDESTVIERVEFMAMLAYPTPDAHQMQRKMDEAREAYQNSSCIEDYPEQVEVDLSEFIQALNAIEQTTERR